MKTRRLRGALRAFAPWPAPAPVLGLALALGACATPPPTLDAQSALAYRNKTLVVAAPAEVVSFQSATPDAARLGRVGDSLRRYEGDSIVQSAGIGDPAEGVGARLASDLHQELATTPAAAVTPFRTDRFSPPALADQARPADLVLALRTTDWRAQFVSDAPALGGRKAQAHLEVEAQLIDTRSSAVLAQSLCVQQAPAIAQQAPTWDELMAHGARRLKQELQAAEAACADELRQRLLGRS